MNISCKKCLQLVDKTECLFASKDMDSLEYLVNLTLHTNTPSQCRRSL